MSSIGLSEWVLLALIGLIVLGPERLPRIASQIGNWIGQARRMTRVMRRQLEEELDLEKTNRINPDNIRPAPPPTDSATTDVDADTERVPANEHDDTWSPEHDAASVGSGVGDDEGFEVAEGDDELVDEPADDIEGAENKARDEKPDDKAVVDDEKDHKP
jgi:sec-independent protein translocase protein TatB